MKVALVYPEVYDLARFREKRKEFPPFGVLYLAAILEGAGFSVEILKVSADKTSHDLRNFDAVGFSIPSSATYGLIKYARMCSLYSNDPLIMVGGVHPNFYPEETLLDIKPHVVGIGECEVTILEILERAKSRDFSDVDGVCFLLNHMPVRTTPRTLIRDISTLPLPARHLLDKEDFIMSDRLAGSDLKMAHVMFSRGCPFPCRFCAAAQTKIQYRDGCSARHELLHLKEAYGIEGFAITDDNFVVNRAKVREICTSIEDLRLKWSALSRVDTVTPDLLRSMKDAGCVEIKFGMESGSEEILAAMMKNITREQIRVAIRTAHAMGIGVKLFVIHGYPGESAKTTKETRQLLEELAPMIQRVSLFRFVPLPGTYVYNNPLEFGLRGTNRNLDWDGDWSKYHIHYNDYHWWGTQAHFEEVSAAYYELNSFVRSAWPDRHDTCHESA